MKKRIFVLGAGCSSHCCQGAIATNLYQKMRQKGMLSNSPLQESFISYVYPDRVPPDDIEIEDLLSAVDCALDIPAVNLGGKFGQKELRIFQDNLIWSIVSFFKNYTTPSRYFNLFASQLTPSDTVITFNYDLVLDYAIGKHLGVELDDAFYFRGRRTGHPRLLKMHGSINWIQEGEDIAVASGWRRKPPRAIIPPTIYKNPQRFLELWEEARKSMRAADEVSFVGYSLPVVDLPSRYLFRRAVRLMNKPQHVTVVNPDPGVLSRYYRQIHDEIHFQRLTFEQWVNTLSSQEEAKA